MKILSVKTSLLLIALAVLLLTVVLTQRMVTANAERALPAPPAEHNDPAVSVIWQHSGSYTGNVVAYGASRSHYEVTLTAQVSGQVNSLSPHFENGYQLQQGDWLAKLENSDYLAEVTSARQALAEAQVSLLEEQRQAQQALLEWQSSGLKGEPDSELVLRKPQIEAAESLVANAKAELSSAEKDLAYTTIKVPFDAVVTSRNISPGSYVQAGTEVASLYSTDRVEVEVALSARDWQNLPDAATLKAGNWPAILTSVEDGNSWSGVVLRTGQHLDAESRQRSIVIAVDNPFQQATPLYPGTFVQAKIAGQQRNQLWQLPSSALSQRGEVWFVREDNTLDKFSASPAFTDAGHIYVSVPEQFEQQQVAVLTHPLNSYLKGMKVSPVEVANE